MHLQLVDWENERKPAKSRAKALTTNPIYCPSCDKVDPKFGQLPVMTRFFHPFWHSLVSNKALSWVALLLWGGGFSITAISVNAQPSLPQPRIFNELPPPSPALPSSPIPTFDVPTSPTPSVTPNDAATEREFNFQASPSAPTSLPSTRSTAPYNLYRVDIVGNNPLLLTQVQQIEPQAFIRQGEGLIQAGVFANESNAQSRVRALAALGIRAQVIPFAINPNQLTDSEPVGSDSFVDVEVEPFSSEPLANAPLYPEFSNPERAYFVVIPGNSGDLQNIAAQVVQLGITENAVNLRNAPRGPHVAVGPFGSRREASQWSNYFRTSGMDARVYYGR